MMGVVVTGIAADAMVRAGRALAWANGMDLDAMDGLLRKVVSQAERARMKAMLRAPSNDDGGTG